MLILFSWTTSITYILKQRSYKNKYYSDTKRLPGKILCQCCLAECQKWHLCKSGKGIFVFCVSHT